MVLGGPEETGQLLEHKFDYIFFTGEGGSGQCPGGEGTLENRTGKAMEGGGGGQCGEHPRGQSTQAGWDPGAGGPETDPSGWTRMGQEGGA